MVDHNILKKRNRLNNQIYLILTNMLYFDIYLIVSIAFAVNINISDHFMIFGDSWFFDGVKDDELG